MSVPPRSTSIVFAFRWILGVAAVSVTAFWFVYRAIDPTYFDPLGLRVGFSGVVLGMLGLTYVSKAVRQAAWHIGLVATSVLTAYFVWLGYVNGLDLPWTVGALAAGCASAFAVAPYARSVWQVWVAIGVLAASFVGTLLAVDATPVQLSMMGGYYLVLVTLAGLAAVAQVRTRDALREGRDALRARERLLRTVIDAIPEHIYVKDREGRCLIRNRFSADSMGLADPDEAIGLTVFDTSADPQVAADYWEEEDRVMRTGEAGIDHEEPYAFDGVRGWIVTSRIPLRDETGAVTGLVGVTRDVTEQKRARAAALAAKEAAEAREAEVAEQRALLQSLFDAIPDAIFVVDMDDRFLAVNQGTLQLLSEDVRDHVVGRTRAEVLAPDIAREYRRYDDAAIASGEHVHRMENDYVTPEGAVVTIETTRVVVRDEAGQPLRVVGVARDVTEQRAAQALTMEAKEAAEAREAEMAAQRTLLRTVIDTIPDHIYVKDREGRATLRNVASARALGYESPEAAVGQADTDSDAEFGAQALADDLQVVRTGVAVRGKEERDLAGGWLLTTKVPLLNPNGTIIGLVGVSRDITAQREAKAALIESKEAAEAAREAAEEATRAKSEFLANMSHEIRTPMNGVIGMTSLLMDTPLGRDQRDFVETIRTSGEALLTIINDILDFSKIEAGMLSLEVQPFEVRTVVEEALDLVAKPAAEKGVELAYLVEDGVPRTVRGDVTRVRQVLVNLLSNAVKFTLDGSVCVRVVAAPPDAAAGSMCRVRFSIEDTGIGIAPDKLESVFESFSQADASTTRQFGGTGLGLTICRRLVDIMGGEMSVESTVGVGSTFRFSIQAEVAPSERRVFLRSEQPVLQGRRVLVVDDNDVNREILTRLSGRWRMSADAVSSGADALAAYRAALADGRPYDLVLLDMQMPEMDGLETATRLQEVAAPAPPVIVMLTSIHQEGTLRASAREAGIAAVLYKPTKPSQLYDVLVDAFDGHPAEGPAGQPLVSPGAPPAAWVSRPAAPVPGLRILLAEDNVVNQKVAVRLLDRLGYTVDVVADGAEALAEVERRAGFGEAYDVVFMDVQMPVMDGLTATRAIRASTAVTQQPDIVALTANAMEGDREACLAVGANDYLSKPVQLDAIRAAMDRAVARRADRAERPRATSE